MSKYTHNTKLHRVRNGPMAVCVQMSDTRVQRRCFGAHCCLVSATRSLLSTDEERQGFAKILVPVRRLSEFQAQVMNILSHKFDIRF